MVSVFFRQWVPFCLRLLSFFYDGTYSETSTFRTAGNDGDFSFAWLSDVHAATADSMGNTSSLLGYAKEKSDISFCLFTGDMVNQGKRYIYWEGWNDSGLLSGMTFAFVIGNHEYYPNKTADKATPSFYLDFVAIPDNNGDSAPADYWFLYDNVLFICLADLSAHSRCRWRCIRFSVCPS